MPLLLFLVDRAVQICSLLILIRVILSWAGVLGLHHPTVRGLDRAVTQLTAPLIDPIRRLMPPAGGFDLSPMVALLLLQVVNQLLRTVLLNLLP
jgi:YggT family protein